MTVLAPDHRRLSRADDVGRRARRDAGVRQATLGLIALGMLWVGLLWVRQIFELDFSAPRE